MKKVYSLGEEIASSILHGLGGGLAIAGLVMAVVKSMDAWQVVSSCIYGASLILLFIMSCLYHALSNATAKKVFRVFDHTGIFFLIAGTYTPYTLVAIRGVWGWVLFGIVWTAAIVGIALNSVSIEKFKKFSMICYIAAGWCVLLAMEPLYKSMEPTGFWLLLGGGMAYTIGILFYRQKGKRWFHAIWHVFVLFAAILQYMSVYMYVLG